MHLGQKISGVELAFMSAWRRGCSLVYILWCTGVIKCKSQRTVLLIFAPQVYANLQRWRTPEELLECTLAGSLEVKEIRPCLQYTVFIRKRYGNVFVGKRYNVNDIVFSYAIVFI